MANIYKDSDKRKKVVPGGEQGVQVKQEREEVLIPPVQPKQSKSLTRNISITLQEEAIEKLNRLAAEQDISKSKFINRLIMSL